VPIKLPKRPLLFVAHPDDESIACAGLLQRVPESLVVFATDGAAPGYGFERRYGSLKNFSDIRFQEATRALSHVPNALFERLTRSDGAHFVDQHLFEEFPEAVTALGAVVQSFSPDLILSHAFEGGHIDHDACAFIAHHVALSRGLKRFEFPLYWFDSDGKIVLQRFRDLGSAEASRLAESDSLEWKLSEAEVTCKRKMLAEYESQSGVIKPFPMTNERMRPAATDVRAFSIASCESYFFQNRRPRFYHTRKHRLAADALLKKFAQFEAG
jgi:LmbE family N-acetylglucosaminyl deacetylase